MGADIDVRNVYGIEGYVTRGILFAASQDGDLLVRLDPESRMEALELSGATTWSPSDDAESYVIIPNYLLNSDETLRFWVTRALEYAEALGIDGDDEDLELEYDEYERAPASDGPMDANGAAHDDGDDEMEGEEVRLPPPAPRPKTPKPAKPAAPAPAPVAAPVAAAAPKPAAKKPAAKKAKVAPKKKAAAPQKAKAAPKKKVAKKPAKKAAKKVAAKKGKAVAKKAKAATKKKAAAKKPMAKKPVARKAKAAPKKKAAAKKPAAKKAKRR